MLRFHDSYSLCSHERPINERPRDRNKLFSHSSQQLECNLYLLWLLSHSESSAGLEPAMLSSSFSTAVYVNHCTTEIRFLGFNMLLVFQTCRYIGIITDFVFFPRGTDIEEKHTKLTCLLLFEKQEKTFYIILCLEFFYPCCFYEFK